MKKLIYLVVILVSFQVMAQEAQIEPAWKTKTRSFVSRILGLEWGERLMGSAPKIKPTITLPEIPKVVKDNTDITSYTKMIKGPTEFDSLSTDMKRQFDYKFLQEIFIVTRKTEPKDEDLANWLNILDQAGSREGIYQSLVLDEVYAALEEMDEKPSKEILKFTLKYSQKFLAQSFREDSIEQINSYSLKRIVTEKFLNLMESFETKDLDLLYRWYAIFSADLATDYTSLMSSPTRSETSPEFHYEWAKAMPIQHIKSEVIIKIHSTMNGLQAR